MWTQQWQFYCYTMGLFKKNKPTSINIVVVWPRPNRASANADAQFGVINKQQTLSSHHHHRQQQPRERPPSPSTLTTITAPHQRRQPTTTTPPHTNADGPHQPKRCQVTERAPAVSTTTHTTTPRRVNDMARQWYPPDVPRR
jgi:hypothetical protein